MVIHLFDHQTQLQVIFFFFNFIYYLTHYNILEKIKVVDLMRELKIPIHLRSNIPVIILNNEVFYINLSSLIFNIYLDNCYSSTCVSKLF